MAEGHTLLPNVDTGSDRDELSAPRDAHPVPGRAKRVVLLSFLVGAALAAAGMGWQKWRFAQSVAGSDGGSSDAGRIGVESPLDESVSDLVESDVECTPDNPSEEFMKIYKKPYCDRGQWICGWAEGSVRRRDRGGMIKDSCGWTCGPEIGCKQGVTLPTTTTLATTTTEEGTCVWGFTGTFVDEFGKKHKKQGSAKVKDTLFIFYTVAKRSGTDYILMLPLTRTGEKHPDYEPKWDEASKCRKINEQCVVNQYEDAQDDEDTGFKAEDLECAGPPDPAEEVVVQPPEIWDVATGFPNIHLVASGYNVAYSDPNPKHGVPQKFVGDARRLASSGGDAQGSSRELGGADEVYIDPGLRKPVFDIKYDTYQITGDRRHRRPDGMFASVDYGCSEVFSTKTISDSYEYTSEINLEASVTDKAGIDITAPPPTHGFSASVGGYGVQGTGEKGVSFHAFVGAEGTLSAKQSKMKKQDLFAENRVTMSSARCAVYKAGINLGHPPPTHPDFIAAIDEAVSRSVNYGQKSCTNGENCVEWWPDWFKIFDEFGTHFLSTVKMGARFGSMMVFKKSQYDAMYSSVTTAGLEVGPVIEAGIKTMVYTPGMKKAMNFKFNPKIKILPDVEVSAVRAFENVSKRVSSEFKQGVGPPMPAEGSNKWMDNVMRSPVPIRFEKMEICVHPEMEDRVANMCKKSLAVYCEKHLAAKGASCDKQEKRECQMDSDCEMGSACREFECKVVPKCYVHIYSDEKFGGGAFTLDPVDVVNNPGGKLIDLKNGNWWDEISSFKLGKGCKKVLLHDDDPGGFLGLEGQPQNEEYTESQASLPDDLDNDVSEIHVYALGFDGSEEDTLDAAPSDPGAPPALDFSPEPDEVLVKPAAANDNLDQAKFKAAKGFFPNIGKAMYGYNHYYGAPFSTKYAGTDPGFQARGLWKVSYKTNATGSEAKYLRMPMAGDEKYFVVVDNPCVKNTNDWVSSGGNFLRAFAHLAKAKQSLRYETGCKGKNRFIVKVVSGEIDSESPETVDGEDQTKGLTNDYHALIPDGGAKQAMLQKLKQYVEGNPTDTTVMTAPEPLEDRVPDGWKVTKAKGEAFCDDDFKTQTVHDANSYEKMTGMSLGIPKTKVAMKGTGGSFGLSFEKKEMLKTSGERKERMTSASIECATYYAEIDDLENNPPVTEPSFQYLVDLIKDEEDFWRIFDLYGTHFPDELVFGSRYGISQLISQSSFETYQMKETGLSLDFGVGVGVPIKGVPGARVQVNRDVSVGYGNKEEKSESVSKYFHEKKSFSVGKRMPAGGVQDWKKDMESEPMPIKFSLVPLCKHPAFKHANSAEDMSTSEDKTAACESAADTYCEKHLKQMHGDLTCGPTPKVECLWGIDCDKIDGAEMRCTPLGTCEKLPTCDIALYDGGEFNGAKKKLDTVYWKPNELIKVIDLEPLGWKGKTSSMVISGGCAKVIKMSVNQLDAEDNFAITNYAGNDDVKQGGIKDCKYLAVYPKEYYVNGENEWLNEK